MPAEPAAVPAPQVVAVDPVVVLLVAGVVEGGGLVDRAEVVDLRVRGEGGGALG